MLREGVGYVRISNFARTTSDELRQKVTGLQQQGMRGLVLDLRWNPGGLLQAAKDVSELFLDKGQLIVYTKGRLAQQNMSYYASGGSRAPWADLPLIVLVNGSSASASEILAGAIQDHDVGVVLGTTSFGKGSVQTVFELTPNEALKLTTAKYYTPSGRSIHKDRTRAEEEALETGEEVTPGTAKTDPEQTPPEVFHTDMGRVVYGGGGIAPDLEVKPELLNDFAVAFERDATFFVYANQYAASHPNVPTTLQVDSRMVDEFFAMASSRAKLGEYLGEVELKLTRELFDENADYMREGIRREIMRRVHGATDAYKVSIEKDKQIWDAADLITRAKNRADLLRLAEQMRQEQLAKINVEGSDSDTPSPRTRKN
jgi:carboxyl-terminal processing protease